MKKLKLRPFTVKRPLSSGELATKTMKRGMPGERPGQVQSKFFDNRKCEDNMIDNEQTTAHSPPSECLNDPHDDLDIEFEDDHSDSMPLDDFKDLASLHEIRQKASVSSWKLIRSSLLTALVENNTLPLHQSCTICNTNSACFRCVNCGPCVYYCYDCLNESHTNRNVFHLPEEWKNGKFNPVSIKERMIDPRPSHNCSTVEVTLIHVIDDDGVQHDVKLRCCRCEPIAITMARVNVWPATPVNPKYAFTFKFLDWAEALLLECQVPLRDLCAALSFKCSYFQVNKQNIYSQLIDTFEEYRYMKQELRSAKFLCNEIDNGNVCPACPKQGGEKIISIDALFGLPRRKGAGKSHRDALHGSLWFLDQDKVDEFVNLAKKPNSNKSDCSEFKAGSALRSEARYCKLDETALFGCACRHEFPLLFLDLKHGERLSYGEYLLKHLVEKNSNGTKLYIMYDIACMFKKHLQSCNQTEILEGVSSFIVPSFHAYGHSAQCQIEYSPLHNEGVGLSDGEVMERLWSYLRRFSRMTKEMRPSHRKEVITHALLHYSFQKTEKLPKLLAIRWKRAKSTHEAALENHKEYTTSYKITEDNVIQWIEAEKATIANDNSSGKRKQVLWVSLVHRQFLLEIKSKYADGQKIAKRLSTQITKESNRFKKLLHQWCISQDLEVPSLVAAMDMSSSFWSTDEYDFDLPSDHIPLRKNDHIPLRKKQEITLNYYLLVRSKEEMEILKRDMENTMIFFNNKIKVVSERAIELSMKKDLFGAGGGCILRKRVDRLNSLLMKTKATVADTEAVMTTVQLDDDDSESESECDTDDALDDLY